MNKQQLIDALAGETGDTKKAVGDFLDALSKVATKALIDGEEVTLQGLGTIRVGDRAARPGRNPKTGEPTTIAAARVPKFKASQKLKNALNA